MIYTTLNRIREHDPCAVGWRKLLKYLGKTGPDDAPLAYSTILESNGLDDALWCLRAEPQHASIWRMYAVRCARRVQHLMTDERSLRGLDVAERHARGLATDEELDTAWDAARVAVWVAARGAARVAARGAARVAAWDAAWDAALVAARVAAVDAAWVAARDAAVDAAWVAARGAARDAAGDVAGDVATVAARYAARGAARYAARGAARDAARVAASAWLAEIEPFPYAARYAARVAARDAARAEQTADFRALLAAHHAMPGEACALVDWWQGESND